MTTTESIRTNLLNVAPMGKRLRDTVREMMIALLDAKNAPPGDYKLLSLYISEETDRLIYGAWLDKVAKAGKDSE